MLASFSVIPMGAGDSVGELVAEAVRVVRQSGAEAGRLARDVRSLERRLR
jgi:uncharacterized protein YqgV (UPF0045/DUF77 family)